MPNVSEHCARVLWFIGHQLSMFNKGSLARHFSTHASSSGHGSLMFSVGFLVLHSPEGQNVDLPGVQRMPVVPSGRE